jgi:RNA polymerase sigma-70 factor (ECF subfamily)
LDCLLDSAAFALSSRLPLFAPALAALRNFPPARSLQASWRDPTRGARRLSDDDDLALALASRNGDRQAFARLVRRHQDRLFRYLHRMTGSRDDALDLAQDAFVRAWQALPGWRPDARFTTWLFQIARNAALDVLRRRGSVEVSAGEEMPEAVDFAADPLRHADAAQQLRLLDAALAALSPEHREILIMRDIEDMAYEEIGAVLALGEGTVKSRLARARAALLARMDVLQGERR